MAKMNETEIANWKGKLENVGKSLGEEWHAQSSHKLLAALEIMDLAGVKDKTKRKELAEAWMKTPSALGANASAFAQQLGREKKEDKAKTLFAEGFDL